MTKEELYQRIREEEGLQPHSKFYKDRLGDQVDDDTYNWLIKYAREGNKKGFEEVLELFWFDLYTPLNVEYDLTDDQVHDFMFLEMKFNLGLEEILPQIIIKNNRKGGEA